MQEHTQVLIACDKTHTTALALGVDLERVQIIRGATDAELLDSLASVRTLLEEGESFKLFTAVGPEEMLARAAIAMLVMRERRMSRRLNAPLKHEPASSMRFKAFVIETGYLISEADDYGTVDEAGREWSRAYHKRVRVTDQSDNIHGEFCY